MNSIERSKNIKRNVKYFMRNMTRDERARAVFAIVDSNQPADVIRAFKDGCIRRAPK